MRPEKILAGMTLKEKVGQLFQVGFPGKEVGPEIRSMITEFKVGGVILFARNISGPDQLTDLTEELQDLSDNPLLISTDQEGGTVNRVFGVTHFPSSMALGATRNPCLARSQGEVMAAELGVLGINLNLAPVLDVNVNPENPVIGVRSLGEDPELVAEMGCSLILGLQAGGIATCAKHFPGHGDTEIDSHLALPEIGHQRERLEEVELLPFRRAIEGKVDCIMTAHVYLPEMAEKPGTPATLSRNVLTGLLREEMEFQGLIITDCMEMKAISDNFGTAEGAVGAIKAGADMVLVSHNFNAQVEAFNRVFEAVKKGKIDRERIDTSVLRVISLKDKLGKKQKVFPGGIDLKRGGDLAKKISSEGLTLVEEPEDLIPLLQEETLLVEKTRDVSDKSPGEKLAELLESKGVPVSFFPLEERGGVSRLPSDKQVLFCAYNARKDPAQQEIIRELKRKERKFMVLGLLSPYDAKVLPPGTGFVTVYDPSPHNLEALSEFLTGRLRSSGQLPVTVEKGGDRN